MKLDNIKNGDIFKNWKEFCKAVEIECKKSNNRKGDERKLSSLCEWHKEGQKVIIDKIFDTPKEIVDGRKNNRGSSNQTSKYEILEEEVMLIIANNINKNDIEIHNDKNKDREKFGKLVNFANENELCCSVYMFGIDLYEQAGMVNSKYRENKYNPDIIAIKNKMSEKFTLDDYKENIWDKKGDVCMSYNKYLTEQAKLFEEDFYMQFKKREAEILNSALNKLAQKRLIHKDYCYLVTYEKERVDENGYLMYDEAGNILYDTMEEYTEINKTSAIENAQAQVLNMWDLDDKGNKKFKCVADVPSYLYPKLNRDTLALLNKKSLEAEEETGEYYWKVRSYFRTYKIYIYEVALERFVRLTKEPRLDDNLKNINNVVTLAVAKSLANACEKAKKGEVQKGKDRFMNVRANNKGLYIEYVKENCSICNFLTDETIEKLIELGRD